MLKPGLLSYGSEEAKQTYDEPFGTTKDDKGAEELAEAVRSLMSADNGSTVDPERPHVAASFSPDLVA